MAGTRRTASATLATTPNPATFYFTPNLNPIGRPCNGREPEDGYRQEEADAEAPAAASAGAGRKRKASRLGLKPAHFRAQQILEGGTRGLRPDGPGDDGGGGGLPRG